MSDSNPFKWLNERLDKGEIPKFVDGIAVFEEKKSKSLTLGGGEETENVSNEGEEEKELHSFKSSNSPEPLLKMPSSNRNAGRRNSFV